MREFCLTEEVLQQFLDNELSPEQSERVASHVTACESCSALLGEVEQESAILMEAFAPEMNLPVPSARLRERIDSAIAELEPPRAVSGGQATSARLRNWFASLFGPLSFTPQRALGFASLAVVLAFASIFAIIQLRHKDETNGTIAKVSERQKIQTPVEQIKTAASPVASVSPQQPDNGGEVPEVKRTAPVRLPRARIDNNAVARKDEKATKLPVDANKPALLPGEKSYLEAIASLTSVIEANKDEILKPAVRADYERNLAVVDQAIVTTRQQAKLNPKDKDATEFMYAAYQNKIDLLSTVAGQTMIASR